MSGALTTTFRDIKSLLERLSDEAATATSKDRNRPPNRPNKLEERCYDVGR